MFPSYLPVKAPDPGAYHFNFLGHNQKCLTEGDLHITLKIPYEYFASFPLKSSVFS